VFMVMQLWIQQKSGISLTRCKTIRLSWNVPLRGHQYTNKQASLWYATDCLGNDESIDSYEYIAGRFFNGAATHVLRRCLATRELRI
jgi:hypothetical protein